jgi:hypothetical protein
MQLRLREVAVPVPLAVEVAAAAEMVTVPLSQALGVEAATA